MAGLPPPGLSGVDLPVWGDMNQEAATRLWSKIAARIGTGRVGIGPYEPGLHKKSIA